MLRQMYFTSMLMMMALWPPTSKCQCHFPMSFINCLSEGNVIWLSRLFKYDHSEYSSKCISNA